MGEEPLNPLRALVAKSLVYGCFQCPYNRRNEIRWFCSFRCTPQAVEIGTVTQCSAAFRRPSRFALTSAPILACILFKSVVEMLLMGRPLFSKICSGA